jgi:DNA-directed RNA polymerase specialized sigma24 family protein
LRKLLERLWRMLSDEGRELFDLLYVDGLSVAEVSARTGKSEASVYQWQSRTRRLARQLDTDLSSKTPMVRRRKLG